MGFKCCADNCRSENNSPCIRLHSFPKDLTLCVKWIEALNKNYKFEVKKSHRLCTKHFEEHYIIRHLFGNVKLKPEAIPTIFVNVQRPLFKEINENSATSDEGSVQFPLSPQHTVQSPSLSQCSVKIFELPLSSKGPEEIEHNYCRLEVGSADVENEPIQTSFQECSSKKKRKLLRYSGDFMEEDLEILWKRKMFWKVYQVLRQENKTRIRSLEQKARRLQQKVDSLNNLVDFLQKKKENKC